MGRNLEPSCRQCRREQMKLFLKGERCLMAKCPIERGKLPPGKPPRRRKKASDYAVRLREKQKLRRMYQMMENQFRLTFHRAARQKGVTGENLLRLLETRLDNVVYRLGFATGRCGARQLVRHGHIRINGKKATIPSMHVHAGDVVEVRDSDRSRAIVADALKRTEKTVVPAWLPVDRTHMRCEVLRIPSREEIAAPVDENLIVEFYSK